jgi:hypothetical protein
MVLENEPRRDLIPFFSLKMKTPGTPSSKGP